MTWQIFIIISLLLFSANSLLHRILMKDDKSDPFAQTLLFYGLGGIFAFIISLLRGGFEYQIQLDQVPYFVVLAIFCTLAPVLAFHAYKKIESSEATILFSSQRLWMVVGAFVVLQETFSYHKIFGTLIILCGISIASWRKQQLVFNQGVAYALIAAFSYAVADIASFFILRNFDAPSFTVFICFIPVILLLIFKPQTIKKFGYYKKPRYALAITVVTINDTLATLAMYYAYQIGRNASQIAPITSTQIILSVILAIIVLKERDHAWQKIVGATIVVAGVLLVI